MTARPSAIHQVVPTLAPRDAIGGHVLEARALLRGMGVESEVFVGEAWPELRRECRPHRELAGGPAGTLLLYHASIGSPVAGWVQRRPEPLVVDYHNITPSSFFAPWAPHVAVELDVGRHQLADLARRAVFGVADSGFNEVELRQVGFGATAVAPILVDPGGFAGEVDAGVGERLAAERSGAEWLFVGRVAPNKCQHDVVAAFALYRRLYDPGARLRLVGGPSAQAYWDAVAGYVAALGLEGAVELAGSVPEGAKAAYFANADVFVCLSEHEGFCVPLLEAWWWGVPVVAFAAAAVPETLGGAGVLLGDKSPARVAAAVDRVVRDARVRAGLVAAGRERLAGEFALERSRARFTAAIEQAIEAAA